MEPRERPKRLVIDRRWLWTAVFVVFLAIVISVGIALRPDSPSDTDNTVNLSMSEYDRAMRLASSGETTEAIAVLEEALALNPKNQLAVSAMADLRARQEEAASADPEEGGNDTTAPQQPPSDEPFLVPVDDLTTLLPASVDGYSLGAVVPGDTDATVSGTPIQPGSITSNALWTVHDLGDPAAAQAFVANTSKSLYPKDAAELSIKSVPAYFGTDGMRFASVSWVRGRFAFELVLSSAGVAPLELKSAVLEAAAAFPETP